MRDYGQSSDEELVLSALTQQPAFAELVHRYEEKLLRYIRRLGVYQDQDAEDLLQNVFLNVYRNLNGFDTSLAFSSWIYRITHNEVVSFFRKNAARPQGHYVQDSENILERLSADDKTSTLAERNLDKDMLNQALARLPQKYRDVIILRYFEEREYKEISDILKISMGSVGTLIHRAKKSLEKQLKNKR